MRMISIFNKTFVFSMFLTGGMFYSGLVMQADKVVNQPLAKSLGQVELDLCHLSGTIIKKKDGIYAAFKFKNSTANDIKTGFHFSAHCTTGASPMSRMMPMPQLVKSERVELALKSGESLSREILLKEIPKPEKRAEVDFEANASKNAKQVDEKTRSRLRMMSKSPDSWTLTVSRKKAERGPGAAVLSFPKEGKLVLKEGQARLAVSVIRVEKIEN